MRRGGKVLHTRAKEKEYDLCTVQYSRAYAEYGSSREIGSIPITYMFWSPFASAGCNSQHLYHENAKFAFIGNGEPGFAYFERAHLLSRNISSSINEA